MAAEDAAVRSRLSRAMQARRLELDLSWDRVAKHAEISIAHLRRVRAGEVTLTAKAKEKIERALRWNPGSIDLVLAGEDPEPVADTRRIAEPNGPAEIPAEVTLDELEPWEAHLWQTPQLSVSDRRSVIDLVRGLRGR
jgi:hypothetical protein